MKQPRPTFALGETGEPVDDEALQDIIASSRIMRRYTTFLRWLVAVLVAGASWHTVNEMRLRAVETVQRDTVMRVDTLDRVGSAALQRREYGEKEVIGNLLKRIEAVEANTARVPALANDIEWIKRTMERELKRP